MNGFLFIFFGYVDWIIKNGNKLVMFMVIYEGVLWGVEFMGVDVIYVLLVNDMIFDLDVIEVVVIEDMIVVYVCNLNNLIGSMVDVVKFIVFVKCVLKKV